MFKINNNQESLLRWKSNNQIIYMYTEKHTHIYEYIYIYIFVWDTSKNGKWGIWETLAI